MTSRRELLFSTLCATALPSTVCARGADCDVIIVGAGGAGLSAAAAASEAGARVILFESQSAVGGNTLRSVGFFNAVDPKRQKAQGIEDSVELFRAHILESGGGHTDPQLAAILAEKSDKMLEYLEENGMRFKPEVIEAYGGHWQRCHIPVLPNGQGYIRTLLRKAMQHGVDIRTDHRVRELIMKNGKVCGVRGTSGRGPFTARANSGVILASGGFGANPDLIARYAPQLAGLTTNNAAGSMGDMLTAAVSVGAAVTDLGEIQCLPGLPPGSIRRVRLHTDVSRFILVDQNGRRFIREDERRDVLRDRVLALPGKLAFSIVDDMGLRSFDILMQKETVLGVESGDAWRGDTIEELAAAMKIPAENLRRTIEDYNRGVRMKQDRFGKSPSELRHEIGVPPFWACYAAMTVHYTMGGVKISPKAEVLNEDGRPIPGLWAAGEVTGGVHGINRMGANGINDGLVFGRIAGQNAAKALRH